MNDNDRKEFGVLIHALFESFQREMTDGVIRGYWFGLGDLSIDEVSTAVSMAIRSCERLPTPHELRKLIGKSTAASDVAISAWYSAAKAVSQVGCYRHVDFDDPLINATIRCFGGWVDFCSAFTSREEEKWLRIEFLRHYQALSASGVDGEMTRPLVGLSQAEVVNGHVVPCQPVRVGGSLRQRLTNSQQTIKQLP